MVQSLYSGDFQERLHVINDAASGVTGIIAIHSTALGPAAARDVLKFDLVGATIAVQGIANAKQRVVA